MRTFLTVVGYTTLAFATAACSPSPPRDEQELIDASNASINSCKDGVASRPCDDANATLALIAARLSKQPRVENWTCTVISVQWAADLTEPPYRDVFYCKERFVLAINDFPTTSSGDATRDYIAGIITKKLNPTYDGKVYPKDTISVSGSMVSVDNIPIVILSEARIKVVTRGS